MEEINGKVYTDEEADAWHEMMNAVMEGEMAEARVYEAQLEMVRPLTPEEVISQLLQSSPEIVDALPDEAVARMPQYFQEWSGNEVAYSVGNIVSYGQSVDSDGATYRCLQAHTSQSAWTPTDAPSLWAKVLTSTGEVLPWEQPSSTNPYMKGDRVLWDGKVWECSINNNVWMERNFLKVF